MRRYLILISTPLIFVVLLSGCFVIENTFTGIPPGPWRGVLLLDGRKDFRDPQEKLPADANVLFEEVTQGELPFNFEVRYPSPDSFIIEIQNGEERILLDQIDFGRKPSRARDSIRIEFPIYNSYIVALYEEDVIEGYWYDRNRGDEYRIPFVAYHGQVHRFTTLKKTPSMDISGRWAVTFGLDDDQETYPAIGEFQQEGNMLTGTFLTETGDYRYLEGTVQADKVYLSTFDGTHAYLFEAKILPDSTMIGTYRSGNHFQTTWEARPDPDARLKSADSLTFIRTNYDVIDFSFENPEGEEISLQDPRYQGKVKVIQIMGTWCPNCRDETDFLLDYIEKNPSKSVAVIALAFEKAPTKADAKAAIRKYKAYMGVPYEILYAGPADKAAAGKALSMLNAVISFPTLLVLDTNNQVRMVHTGFAGPATSKYKDFTTKFDKLMAKLLARANPEG